MRVAFPLGGTDLGRSGIGTYVREVLPRLSRKIGEAGHELAVIGNLSEFEAYDDAVGGAMRVEVSELIDRPALSAFWYLQRVDHQAKRARADVLLLPAANRRLAMRPRLPTVAVVHDLAQLHVAKKYDALRMFYLRQVVMRALASTHQLVAVSEATRVDLEDALPRPHPPIRVVPNGVNYERFLPPEPDDPRIALARTKLRLDGRYLLYASRLEHPGKNHLRLLEAFALSSLRNKFMLALAGKDWGAESMIRETIERLGLRDQVRLLGFVADELLPGLVAGSEVVIMVGLREGFGLPALEALAAGRMVCVSTTGALPEVVGPLGVLVDPLSVDAIRHGLEVACASEELRARCAKEGPLRAVAHSWENTASGLLDACHAAVAG